MSPELLCALYFGPETRAAVTVFEDSPTAWWEQKKSMFKQLGDALWQSCPTTCEFNPEAQSSVECPVISYRLVLTPHPRAA